MPKKKEEVAVVVTEDVKEKAEAKGAKAVVQQLSGQPAPTPSQPKITRYPDGTERIDN